MHTVAPAWFFRPKGNPIEYDDWIINWMTRAGACGWGHTRAILVSPLHASISFTLYPAYIHVYLFANGEKPFAVRVYIYTRRIWHFFRQFFSASHYCVCVCVYTVVVKLSGWRFPLWEREWDTVTRSHLHCFFAYHALYRVSFTFSIVSRVLRNKLS